MSNTIGQDGRAETQTGPWAPPKTTPANLSPEDHAKWLDAATRAREVAEREKLSKSEVARRANVPMGTFSPWYDGTYNGRVPTQTRLVLRWLDSVEERARFSTPTAAPGFVQTPTASEVMDICAYAQAMPAMAVIVLGPGLGKTYTARHFAKTRPHTTLVTMRPTTANFRGVLNALSQVLEVRERSLADLDMAIGERLRRNGRHTLLIVDEAQNLADSAVNQLRYFLDEFGTGIVLLGNEELYGRFGGQSPKPAYAQLHRRISRRLHRIKPLQADIDAFVAAWRIDDKEIVNLARAIGRKPGALGQITETLTLAHMMAVGDDAPLSVEHVRRAWENRGDEQPRLELARAAA